MHNIRDVIEDLRGTCQSLEQVCYIHGLDGDDLSMEELVAIDDEIFCCVGCSWWCEIDEAVEDNGESVCRDCAEDRGIDPDN